MKKKGRTRGRERPGTATVKEEKEKEKKREKTEGKKGEDRKEGKKGKKGREEKPKVAEVGLAANCGGLQERGNLLRAAGLLGADITMMRPERPRNVIAYPM